MRLRHVNIFFSIYIIMMLIINFYFFKKIFSTKLIWLVYIGLIIYFIASLLYNIYKDLVEKKYLLIIKYVAIVGSIMILLFYLENFVKYIKQVTF